MHPKTIVVVTIALASLICVGFVGYLVGSSGGSQSLPTAAGPARPNPAAGTRGSHPGRSIEEEIAQMPLQEKKNVLLRLIASEQWLRTRSLIPMIERKARDLGGDPSAGIPLMATTAIPPLVSPVIDSLSEAELNAICLAIMNGDTSDPAWIRFNQICGTRVDAMLLLVLSGQAATEERSRSRW